MARRKRLHHHVYVVELSKDVLLERKFRRCNPGYVDGKPCVYVGMTGLDPDVRFDKHMAGIQANAYVTRYGLRLLPDLFEGFNPMSYEDAQAREVEIGIDLRSAGFARLAGLSTRPLSRGYGPPQNRSRPPPLPPGLECTARAWRVGCRGRPRWWWCSAHR